MRLTNILRRALGRPLPLRLGALRWVSRDRLRVCLHEPGEVLDCCELEVAFALTGLPGQEVHVRLVDLDGDPCGAQWLERHGDTLLADLWDEHLAEPYLSGRHAAVEIYA